MMLPRSKGREVIFALLLLGFWNFFPIGQKFGQPSVREWVADELLENFEWDGGDVGTG